MDILLNGSEFKVEEQSTVLTLIDQLGLAGKRYAIELNKEIIPRSLHAETSLQAGDKIEVVQAIGGG